MVPSTSGTTAYCSYVEDTGTNYYENQHVTETYLQVCKEEKEPFDPVVAIWVIHVEDLFEIILRKLIIIQIRGPPS